MHRCLRFAAAVCLALHAAFVRSASDLSQLCDAQDIKSNVIDEKNPSSLC